MTHFREVITQVMGDDQKSKESIEQAVHKYRQTKGKLDYCRHELLSIIKERMPKDREQLEHYIANILADLMINDNKVDIDGVRVHDSIAFPCRCKTTDGLLDLDKLVASGGWDKLFSRIMSCLINKPVAASVSLSDEEFKNCLVSLNADAG